MGLLDKGVVCQATSGTTYMISQLIGSGGQGEVYQASHQGRQYAVKWYYKDAATPDQHDILKQLVKQGPPSDEFLWPLEIVTCRDHDGFGYVMDLRTRHYIGIVDLMKKKVDVSFKTLLMAGFNLVSGYKKLHSKGLCYRDISFGNVFFDPKNGKALICDNDNVSYKSSQHKITVSGTPRFMAPEIVLGQSEPTSNSDRFSLAILLFYMLMIAHPLDGKLESQIKSMDMAAMKQLYGTHPIFIFDPRNSANRPDPQFHQNALIFWDIYPQFIKDKFTEAFTSGLKNPDQRVVESQWRKCLLKAQDTITICNHCGVENFHCITKLAKFGELNCWHCRKVIATKPRMKLSNGSLIVLDPGVQLFSYHLEQHPDYDKITPVAIVDTHPNQPSVLGLKNLASQVWHYTTINGQSITVNQNMSVKLIDGISIDFGHVSAQVRT